MHRNDEKGVAMAKHKPLPIDPIAEAKRQWIEHDWNEAAPGMAAMTSIMRAQQLVLSRVENVLRPFGLSFARFELLRLLAFSRGGRMPMASVVTRLQVHPASVTSVVDRLSRADLVMREPHPQDGRATMLVLTDEGREVVEQATVALNDEVFTRLTLSNEDISALTGILARMRKAAGDFTQPAPAPAPLEDAPL